LRHGFLSERIDPLFGHGFKPYKEAAYSLFFSKETSLCCIRLKYATRHVMTKKKIKFAVVMFTPNPPSLTAFVIKSPSEAPSGLVIIKASQNVNTLFILKIF